MKRLFFSLLAACSFAVASAQPVADASVIISKLHLDNVILMIPPVDFVQTHFSDAGDYLDPNGRVLEDSFGNETSPFLVFSNRNFNVAIKSATANFARGINICHSVHSPSGVCKRVNSRGCEPKPW